jgi:ATP-dependent DNA ligase
LQEIKLDGWRGQLHKCGGEVRLYSKRGNDLFDCFRDLVRAVAQMPIAEIKTSAWKEANRERWKSFERQA